MKRKSARKHSSRSQKAHKRVKSPYLKYLGIAFVILVIILLLSNASKGRNVLGDTAPPPGSPPSGGSAPAQSAPAQQAAPQQSAPAQQQAPQQSAPAQQTQPQPQHQTQSSGQQMPQGGMNPQQMNQQQMTPQQQQQYQQYQGASKQEQQNMMQQYQQTQGNQQYTQQGQPQPQGNQQQGGSFGGVTGKQTVSSTNPNGANTNTQQQNNYQGTQVSPQTVEQMRQQWQQQMQQWQQEAAKNGFQISTTQFPQNGQGNTQNNNGSFQNNNNNSQNGNGSFQNNSSFQTLPSLSQLPSIKGVFNVSAANNTNVNINDGSTKVVLGGQGSNQTAKVVKSDGTQVQINKTDVDKIVKAMEIETGSQIKNSGNTFIMTRGTVEASTTLPVSFNIATKTLTVQTPNGVQEVKVLPDEAIQRVLAANVIGKLDTSITGQQAGNSSTSKVELTQVNNEIAYKVQGSIPKRFLGVLPVSISKTAFLSAKDGKVISTTQGFFSRFLGTISF